MIGKIFNILILIFGFYMLLSIKPKELGHLKDQLVGRKTAGSENEEDPKRKLILILVISVALMILFVFNLILRSLGLL